MNPQPVLRMLYKLVVSLTMLPPITLIAKKTINTFIYFICISDWKCWFSHCEDLEISQRRVALMPLNMKGRKTLGIEGIVRMLELWANTIVRKPIKISKPERTLKSTNRKALTF